MTDENSDWQRPFAHLNLRRNPFGDLPRRRRGQIAVGDRDAAVEHLRNGTSLQYGGPRGSGKSTALHALEVRLETASYRRVPRQGGVDEWPASPILLVDEVQFLKRATRRTLWNREATLAVATHTDFADEVRASGRSVETIDFSDPRSVDELAAMFRRRIEAHRRNDGPVPTIARATVRRLRQRYGANHRSMENHLYEILQTLEEPRTVEAADLEAIDPPSPVPESPNPRGP